jgi:hypothetical protein
VVVQSDTKMCLPAASDKSMLEKAWGTGIGGFRSVVDFIHARCDAPSSWIGDDYKCALCKLPRYHVPQTRCPGRTTENWLHTCADGPLSQLQSLELHTADHRLSTSLTTISHVREFCSSAWTDMLVRLTASTAGSVWTPGSLS